MITPKELVIPDDAKGIKYSLVRAWRELLIKINASLIQWRDEGTDLGAVGQVNKVNFTGAGVTATVTDSTLTVAISGGGGGGLSDGDYGDIIVSGGATVLTVDTDVITYAKMQNVSAADRLLGRGNGGGAGDVQEITLGTNLSMAAGVLNATGGSSTEPNIVDATTARTLVLTDAGNSIEFTNTAAVTVTVPLNATVAFPLYTIIYFIQGNTGQVTCAATGGVTIEYPDTLKTRKRESVVGIKKLATDTWQFFGDFEFTGGAATAGTATIDFGASPGLNETSIAVTGQTNIATTSLPRAYFSADATSSGHTANDHKYIGEFVSLSCGTPTAATGFTIYARSAQRIEGNFTVNWAWQ